MSIKSALEVRSTSRSIREELFLLKSSNLFLKKYIAIGEFFKKAVIVKDRINIDSDKRVLLLLQATNFQKFSQLQLERNFFTFLNNSEYIFTFFEELSTELVSIDDLKFIDIYSEYEEHIEILKIVYGEFIKLLEKNGYNDKIIEPYIAELNVSYIESFDEITLQVDGYLSAYELKILDEISKHTALNLKFNATSYNEKMTQSFNKLGFELERAHSYLLDFSNKKMLSNTIIDSKIDARVSSFNQRILQVAFVKHSIYKMISSGIDVEEIVVILPDESFAHTLKLFDSENNFNFAMGISIERSFFIRALESYVEYMSEQSMQNRLRLQSFEKEIFEILDKHYYESIDSDMFEKAIEKALHVEPVVNVKKIVSEELFYFKKLIDELDSITLKEALHIFLNRVRSKTIDDVGGGKVTVMGLLESRGVSYEGVVIVDFNSSYVPRSSQKDMFLNSSMKKAISLPTTQDRQNLQKHYYYELMRKAKSLYVSFVENDQSRQSPFLSQLNINKIIKADEKEYSKILFGVNSSRDFLVKELEFEYNLALHTLSATSLKSFLECKRQFFYRYIQKIRSHERVDELPKEYEIGSLIHSALQSIYSQKSSFEDEKELRDVLFKELSLKVKDNILQRFQLKMWEKKLDKFIKNEIERFRGGVRVLHVEKSYEVEFCGFNLSGRIDRVDILDEQVQILDYKSGKYNLYTSRTLQNATDFQLEFYYLFLAKEHRVDFCGFYDLNSALIVQEPIMQEKLERLQEILNELNTPAVINFEMCDNIQKCSFCDYSKLCGRF